MADKATQAKSTEDSAADVPERSENGQAFQMKPTKNISLQNLKISTKEKKVMLNSQEQAQSLNPAMMSASWDFASDSSETRIHSANSHEIDDDDVHQAVRQLELREPPLTYKLVITNSAHYSQAVLDFLLDIADEDAHYMVYEVQNWWDDVQRFQAIVARCVHKFSSPHYYAFPFIAVCTIARFYGKQHGVTFQVAFHTLQSWSATTAQAEYLRRKFDTVIKTDTIFCHDPGMLEEAQVAMQREDQWKERWSRVTVPERALTIGTLRYGNGKSEVLGVPPSLYHITILILHYHCLAASIRARAILVRRDLRCFAPGWKSTA